MKKFTALLLSPILALMIAGSANAIPVDLELSLLIDVSGSVSDAEFALQRGGYVTAFESTSVWDAINLGAIKSIAVNTIYWSGVGQQKVAMDWTLINSQTASSAFAASLSATTRDFNGLTAVQTALKFGADTFQFGGDNGFEGTRQVIDISGDGTSNDGVGGVFGRDYALGLGVDTINGVVIGGSSSVLNYYQNSVIGGTNSFVLKANNFSDFESVIDQKLIREIGPEVPEPTTILLMGAGLLGLIGYKRKRFSKKS